MFFHFNARQRTFLAVFAALAFTVFPAFHSKIITVAIFFLTPAFAAVAALKLLSVFLLQSIAEGTRLPAQNLSYDLSANCF